MGDRGFYVFDVDDNARETGASHEKLEAAARALYGLLQDNAFFTDTSIPLEKRLREKLYTSQLTDEGVAFLKHAMKAFDTTHDYKNHSTERVRKVLDKKLQEFRELQKKEHSDT